MGQSLLQLVPYWEMFDNPILPIGRVNIIKALVQSHMQKSLDDSSGDKTYELYSADAIRGKDKAF